MNCKQGDLAIIVKSICGNEGKIVRCLEYIGVREFISPNGTITEDHCWRIDRPTRTFSGIMCDRQMDCCLKPIRDNDNPDETLEWAGLPKKEEIKV